ncbi:MAG: YifB family Mg chelatase-like AAA ATPase [Candidatus Pacebacteria bacterium]|nr:YifB family Mg chelatase-like AAA ATPase [Candidatus Paceibacterota bacterium]
MAGSVSTVALQGIEILDIEVQVQLTSGAVAFIVVGLPDKAVRESCERVRSALAALGLSFPPKRVVVNLAPADVLKEGSHFDLPIALSLLMAMEIISQEDIADYIVLGELGLDGSIAPVVGVLPAAFAAARSGRGIICPSACGGEARWAGELEVLAPHGLLELINHFKGTQVLSPPEPRLEEAPDNLPDLRDIKGQESAKRALEIAAAGGHNMLMIGPPGSGKSMLAARLPGLLPPLEAAEALEVSMIHSVAGQLAGGRLLRQRPFRDPHFTASTAALVGGGIRARPGEISLAHCGVLFLDELPEYQRGVLESLRQPLETGRATVARANNHISYPSRVQLVAAMNPCRCGYNRDEQQGCGSAKAPRCAADYQSRISGPLFDRIDIHVEVNAVPPSELAQRSSGEASAVVAARVAKARLVQRKRLIAHRGQTAVAHASMEANAVLDGEELVALAAPSAAGQALLTKAAEQMRLSARGYHRILRVARTIADLEAAASVEAHHIAEALSFRRIIHHRG